MSDLSIEYLVPDGTRAADIATLSQRRWRVVEEPVETLTSNYYDTFDWAIYLAGGVLEAQVPDHPRAANAARAVKSVADARIWRLVKRVRREGRAIRPESPSQDLHELRKSCKKLRYLMEFFQSLYPGEEIRGLVRVLKVLLDNLGGYRDLAVQAAHLRELAQRMRDEGQADTDTLLAIGALIGNLLARQQKARAAFREVFDGFLREEHHRTFRSLFAAAPDAVQRA